MLGHFCFLHPMGRSSVFQSWEKIKPSIRNRIQTAISRLWISRHIWTCYFSLFRNVVSIFVFYWNLSQHWFSHFQRNMLRCSLYGSPIPRKCAITSPTTLPCWNNRWRSSGRQRRNNHKEKREILSCKISKFLHANWIRRKEKTFSSLDLTPSATTKFSWRNS